MKILLLHNYYTQAGGEDAVFEADRTLLRSKGHNVVQYTDDNNRISSTNPLNVAMNTIWSRSTYEKVKREVEELKPDVAQFYNIFPLISPAAYYACQACNVPVIQYLFNPRLICPAATLYRDGKLCTDCIGKIFSWPGVLHACYHRSRIHTLAVASMNSFHQIIKTWRNTVDIYMSATAFYRDLYAKGGLPPEKIIIKPNYIFPDPGVSTLFPGEYALFVGRLDPEKGVKTLMEAWKSLNIPLKIRGSGNMEQFMKKNVNQNEMLRVEFLGRLEEKQMTELRRRARFLVWPSEGYYETFGLAAVECFAQGIPVIASNIGVMAEIVQDGRTGLLFKAGDPADLASKATWLWNHPAEAARMGRNARNEFDEKYTAERNYRLMMELYSELLKNRKGKS